jgi:hypothetical protein
MATMASGVATPVAASVRRPVERIVPQRPRLPVMAASRIPMVGKRSAHWLPKAAARRSTSETFIVTSRGDSGTFHER